MMTACRCKHVAYSFFDHLYYTPVLFENPVYFYQLTLRLLIQWVL